MKRAIFCAALMVGGLGAQSLSFFQAPGGAQVYEVHPSGVTYLGVNLAEVNADRARELKLKEPYGVEITRVEEGSPADKAGLKTGDVVSSTTGTAWKEWSSLGGWCARRRPGGRRSCW